MKLWKNDSSEVEVRILSQPKYGTRVEINLRKTMKGTAEKQKEYCRNV